MKNFFYITILICAFMMVSCNDDDQPMTCEECSLIPDPGPCRASIPRYFFNQQIKQCEEFTWGGCFGVVPFETMQECIDCCEN